MVYPLKSMSLGEVVDVAFRVFRDNFLALFLIAVAVQVPFTVLMVSYVMYLTDPLAEPSGFQLFMMSSFALMGALVVQPLTNGASTKLIAERYRGRNIGVGASFAAALKLLPGLLGAVLLSGLLISLGTLLLIIPGILLAIKFSMVAPATVVERAGGTTAMRRSSDLAKGSGGKIFGAFVLMIAFGMAIYMCLELLGVVEGSLEYTVIDVAFQVVASAYMAAVWTVMYFACRCEREGFDLEVLASSLGGDE